MNENNEKNQELTQLLEDIKKSPKVTRVSDESLYSSIESLIQENSNQLHGEYSFYCVYQKPLGSTERYALIHAFYLEEDGLKLEDMDRIILEDGKLMHQKLKEAKLECDYFYVMPYFDFTDKAQGSVLLNDRILLTNEP